MPVGPHTQCNMKRDCVQNLNNLYTTKVLVEDVQMPTGEQPPVNCNYLPEDCEACEGVYGDHVEHTEEPHIVRQTLFKINKLSSLLFNKVAEQPLQKEDKYKVMLALDHIKEVLHKYSAS